MSMLSDEQTRVAAKAQMLFQEKYRAIIEKSNFGAFICIEPESGDYFLGQKFDDAVNQALDAYPERLSHTIRIGHHAAFHFRAMIQ